MEKKLVVLFPGIGYHNDKPLMYYTKRVARNKGYEIVEVTYDFPEPPKDIKDHPEKIEEAYETAFNQVKEQLADIAFTDYDRVVFVGKSIGTVVMARYSMTYELEADMVVYTPIPDTFNYLSNCEGFLFHGSADPFCDTDMCVQLCEELSLTYAVIPEANHSLETGDVDVDIKNLGRVMNIVGKLL